MNENVLSTVVNVLLTLYGIDMIAIIVVWPGSGKTLQRMIVIQHSVIALSQSQLRKNKSRTNFCNKKNTKVEPFLHGTS